MQLVHIAEYNKPTVPFRTSPLILCHCPSDYTSFMPLRIFQYHCLSLSTGDNGKPGQQPISLSFYSRLLSKSGLWDKTYSGSAQTLKPPPLSPIPTLDPSHKIFNPLRTRSRECDHQLAFIPPSNPIKSPRLTDCFSQGQTRYG